MEEKLLHWPVAEGVDFHEKQAAHFRSLASTATTAAIKARLLHEADQHERLARGEPPLGDTDE